MIVTDRVRVLYAVKKIKQIRYGKLAKRCDDNSSSCIILYHCLILSEEKFWYTFVMHEQLTSTYETKKTNFSKWGEFYVRVQ